MQKYQKFIDAVKQRSPFGTKIKAVAKNDFVISFIFQPGLEADFYLYKNVPYYENDIQVALKAIKEVAEKMPKM